MARTRDGIMINAFFVLLINTLVLFITPSQSTTIHNAACWSENHQVLGLTRRMRTR